MLMLVGLVAAGAPLPYTAVAVVPLLWSGFESVLAIRARSAGLTPTGSIVSSVVGLALVGVLTSVVLLEYVVYDTAKSLQDCTSGANTAVAMADCRSQYNHSLTSFLGGFLDAGR
jgi:hypothetical protein